MGRFDSGEGSKRLHGIDFKLHFQEWTPILWNHVTGLPTSAGPVTRCHNGFRKKVVHPKNGRVSSKDMAVSHGTRSPFHSLTPCLGASPFCSFVHSQCSHSHAVSVGRSVVVRRPPPSPKEEERGCSEGRGPVGLGRLFSGLGENDIREVETRTGRPFRTFQVSKGTHPGL